MTYERHFVLEIWEGRLPDIFLKGHLADLMFRHKQQKLLSQLNWQDLILRPPKCKCSYSLQKRTKLAVFTNYAMFSFEGKYDVLKIASTLVATGSMVTEFRVP